MENRFSTITIAFLLAVTGVVVSFMCLDETGVTSLLSYHDGNVFHSYTTGPIASGQDVVGEFRATDDNLAMVKLRIRTFNRLNTTHVRFLFREKGKSDWQVSNSYTVDRFPDGLLYPFGFSAIPDSRGKIYEFMINSPDGTSDNAIGISRGFHDVASQYVYQKNQLTKDMQLLQTFLAAKIRNFFDPYCLLYVSMFIVPAAALVLRRFGLGLTLFMALVYTYLPISTHSNTILFVAATLLFVSLYSHISSSLLYWIAFAWSFQIPLTLLCAAGLAAHRVATLLFFLVFASVIISVKELKKR
jgi:hypothetical protein